MTHNKQSIKQGKTQHTLNTQELTKVVHEDDGECIETKGQELGHHHERMPTAHCEAHHEELSEDEGREADAHNVDQLILKQQHRPIHQHTAWERRGREGKGVDG